MATTRKSSKKSSAKSPIKAVTKAATPKPSKLGYWIFTLLLTLPMLVLGAAAVFGVDEVVSKYTDLGYPSYFAVILGIAKFFGAIAIISGRVTWLKEWAYAGFTFDFLSVIASEIAVYHITVLFILPIVFLVLLYFSHHFWKRLSETQGIAYTRLWFK